MMDNAKMRLMCGITAAAVTIGSFAMPVNVFADDDMLDDLVGLVETEEAILQRISDADKDGDIDESDVQAAVVAMTVVASAEDDIRHDMELEAARLAEQSAREAQIRAQLEAAEAQRRLEEERRLRNQRVSGVWISSSDVTLTPGQTYQVTAGVRPDTAKNRTIRFSTSDWNVASIDASGIIRGNNVGSCYVTATSDDGGYQARAYVRVNPAPAAVAQTISQDNAWTAAAANIILAAAPKAKVNLVAPKALSFDAGMLNALALRPDVSLNIAYPYNGHSYLLVVPAGYNLVSKMDKTGKVSFIKLAAVKDKKLTTTMIQ